MYIQKNPKDMKDVAKQSAASSLNSVNCLGVGVFPFNLRSVKSLHTGLNKDDVSGRMW